MHASPKFSFCTRAASRTSTVTQPSVAAPPAHLPQGHRAPPDRPAAEENHEGRLIMSTHERHNRRKTLIGFVSSKMGDKSVKFTVPYKTPHPLYHKVINRKTVLHVHYEKNEAKMGDKIEVMETRPISRLKRWRVIRVVEA